MMHNWGAGMGWGFGGGIVMLLILIAVVVGVALLVRWLLSGGEGRLGSGDKNARDALQERYARGEISREEYLQIKKDSEE